MGIVSVTGTERREFERNAIPMRTVDGALINAKAIKIKDIGNEKPNSSGYKRKLNEEFGGTEKFLDTSSNKANMKTRRSTCY